MKRILFLSLVLALLTLAANPSPQAQAPVPWQTLAPGIEFYKFKIPASDKALGPNEVFVARMDRSRRDVTLDTSLANARLNNKTPSGVYSWEPISRQVQRYQGALNYWGGSWGGRNNVVVAINGYYHEDKSNGKDTSMPERGQVQSGWYVKRYYDFQLDKLKSGGSGFVWTLDGEAFIGSCVRHYPPAQSFIHPNDDPEGKKFQGINELPEYRPANSLILYTPQFGSQTPEADTYDVLVEMHSPTLIQASSSEVVTGTVKGIYEGGDVPLPFAHVVFSASGDRIGPMQRLNIQPGDVISVTQKVDHFVSGCSGPVHTEEKTFARAYASLGTDFHFLQNGQVMPYSNEYEKQAGYRQPRTAIAFNDRYIFFIVVDGYHQGVSEGMTIEELGRFARDYLGATEAAALDSGTSSTFVINGQTVNNYVCNANWHRKNPDCNPQPSPQEEPVDPLVYPGSFSELGDDWSDPLATQEVREPPLVNGLMMISVQETKISEAFAPNTSVTTLMETQLRLGPGRNYLPVDTVPAGAQVNLLPHSANGVLVDGNFWFKAEYNGREGWIPQGALPVDLPFHTLLPLISAP